MKQHPLDSGDGARRVTTAGRAGDRDADGRSDSVAETRGLSEISPDGRLVAYTLRDTNWDDNAYETEIWVADVESGKTYALTNAKKSSQSPAWSPDGSRLAFVSDRTDKRQIYVDRSARW
jgi:Tol biopolymer transport system component